MMRCIIICATIFMIAITASPSFAEVFGWALRAGSSDSRADHGHAVAVDSSGNTYITGDFYGSATFGTKTLTSAGDKDVFIAKINSAGNYVWAVKAGGIGLDRGRGIAVDGSGNVYVSGYFQKTATFGGFTLTEASSGDPLGTADIFVTKLDTNGNFLWAIKAGGLNFDHSQSICVDDAGNLYLTGYFQGTASFGNMSLTSVNYYDLFVAKLSPSGTFLWVRGMDGREWGAHSIAASRTNEIYVTGYFRGTANFGSHTLVSSGDEDIFILRLNSEGDILWAQKAGGPSTDRGEAVAVSSTGQIFITGSFKESATFGTVLLSSLGGSDTFISKLNSDGNFLWTKQAGGIGNIIGRGIATDEYGDIYVVGSFTGVASFGTNTLTSQGLTDMMLARLDSTGTFVSALAGSGSQSVSGQGIAVDSSSNAYTIGDFRETATFGAHTVTSIGGVNIFVVSCYPTTPNVAAPVFNPDGGAHTGSSVNVTVSCATAGATIRYTTNGSEPTESSPAVASGGTVSVPVPGTLKAKAFKSGMNPSATKSANYTAAPAVTTPTFNPDGGAHPGSSVSVTVSCATAGATIRYTTNGSEPTESSPVVASGGTVSVPVPGTLKAKAWKTDMNPSATKSASYTAAPSVATPTFNPDGGAHPGSSVNVTVSCATVGATIRYTTNGSEPTESSSTVASGGTVSVPLPGTLKAGAWKDGMNPSLTKSANYLNQYTLLYTAGEGGSITGETTQTVIHGADGTAVTAVPDEGHHFVQWSDGSTANSRRDTGVTGNITVEAQFAVNQYTITVLAAPEAGGSVTGGGAYEHGQTVSVTATANEGYSFVNWTEGGEEVSTDAGYAFVANQSRTLTANFLRHTGTLSVTIKPEAARAAGARWSIDGGVTWVDGNSQILPTDLYTISFKEIPGWETPVTITGLEVKSGRATARTGYYGEIKDVTPDNGSAAVDFPHSMVEITIETDTSGSITVTRYQDDDKSIPEGKGAAGIYLQIERSSSLANCPARIEVSYDRASLPANVLEDSLRIWRYNAEAEEWVQLPGGVDSENSIVLGEAEEFSVFGIFGETLRYGDANGDGEIDVGDAIMVLRHIVGLQSLDQTALQRARVSSTTGEVDVSDAILILRHIVGVITEFPVEVNII